MSQNDNDETDSDSPERAAEYLRLVLTQLRQHQLPVSPVNYSLMYFHVAGKDVALSKKIDQLLNQSNDWNDEKAKSLFSRFICQCQDNDFQDLRDELVMTMAQIIGYVIDLAGKAALSNSTLEKHMSELAVSNQPKEILAIASNIIADTRGFLEQSKTFEANLMDSTQEISFLKDELDQARRMATTDALTGLFNRRGFDEELLISINQVNSEDADSSNFCLLIIDIDHFKLVNDTHGHLVGDKVLVGISKVLHKQMRGKDHLSRYGGEEFAAILKDTPLTGAFTVAENLRRITEKLRLKHIKTGQQLGQITISIGVACYRKGETLKDFIHRSDNALYRAKSLGRNRSVIAD